METKKNQNANVEKLRLPIALTGLLFTGSIVLASFTYRNGTERDEQVLFASSGNSIQFQAETVENTPAPPEMPETPTVQPPDENIIIDTITRREVVHVIPVLPPPRRPGGTIIAPPEPPIIEFPDVEARFNGNMQQWIAEHVVYPQTSIELNEQGTVYLSFVVNDDGTVANINITRGVSSDIDREAKRLLREMPKWTPGEHKGHKVNTRCHIPIKFTLQP